MEWISGTRVTLTGTDQTGTVEFPEPWQAPQPGRVLVLWDGRQMPLWELTDDLTAD